MSKVAQTCTCQNACLWLAKALAWWSCDPTETVVTSLVTRQKYHLRHLVDHFDISSINTVVPLVTVSQQHNNLYRAHCTLDWIYLHKYLLDFYIYWNKYYTQNGKLSAINSTQISKRTCFFVLFNRMESNRLVSPHWCLWPTYLQNMQKYWTFEQNLRHSTHGIYRKVAFSVHGNLKSSRNTAFYTVKLQYLVRNIEVLWHFLHGELQDTAFYTVKLQNIEVLGTDSTEKWHFLYTGTSDLQEIQHFYRLQRLQARDCTVYTVKLQYLVRNIEVLRHSTHGIYRKVAFSVHGNPKSSRNQHFLPIAETTGQKLQRLQVRDSRDCTFEETPETPVSSTFSVNSTENELHKLVSWVLTIFSLQPSRLHSLQSPRVISSRHACTCSNLFNFKLDLD